MNPVLLAELEPPPYPDLLQSQNQPQFFGETVGVMKLFFFSFPAEPGSVIAKVLRPYAGRQSHRGETLSWLQRPR